MKEIPEEYRNDVIKLCRLYNIFYDGNLKPDSITTETHLKNDLGLRRINKLALEDALGRSYPTADGLTFASGIRTVGDVINYINRKLVQQ
ncbi:MAG: hypothetical protein J7K54_02885 [Candidatus Aenigmarchaeota archaeon]|nr:hypothetical protein [Candidatus Aenigmarchaeota archaeon]